MTNQPIRPTKDTWGKHVDSVNGLCNLARTKYPLPYYGGSPYRLGVSEDHLEDSLSSLLNMFLASNTAFDTEAVDMVLKTVSHVLTQAKASGIDLFGKQICPCWFKSEPRKIGVYPP